MSELSELLDVFIKDKEKYYVDSISTEEKEELQRVLRDSKEKAIKDEIAAELEPIIYEKVEREYNEKTDEKNLKDIKNLMIEGVVVAFVVGLLVNQITDIFGYFKGTISSDSLSYTIIYSVILLIICVAIFTIVFLTKAIELIKRWKKA